jgi:hypothetical protein
MAKYVLRDAYVAINGTAFSDHASSVQLEDTADQIDFTGFSSAGYKQYGQGLHDAKITCTFFSDFAAAQINSVLQPLYASGGTFSVEIRPTSATVTATNPKATMTASLFSYSGINGKIGDAADFDAVFQNAGTAGLVWGTT